MSGSSDSTVRIWRSPIAAENVSECLCVLHGHSGSITCLAIQQLSVVFASGAADATVRIWRLGSGESQVSGNLVQTIDLNPSFVPLALAIQQTDQNRCTVLAVGGTRNDIFLYASDPCKDNVAFFQAIRLSGHEGWVRSLAFTTEPSSDGTHILLASASQDKYIRTWRISQTKSSTDPGIPGAIQSELGLRSRKLTARAPSFSVSQIKFAVTFESLLSGHEDWVHAVTWNACGSQRRLLSASADNSVAIWEPESASGIWTCITRLGEVSVQKGSTTATGSFGGLWTALWGPDGNSIAALGRTGSWRVWSYHQVEDRWVQRPGISGHFKAVRGLAWAKDGGYLVSTSLDQTTRVHACLNRKEGRSWHEIARAQIHGFDLTCIDTLNGGMFVSGAEEKLLRVFSQPRSLSDSLAYLLEGKAPASLVAPQVTTMPTLGLSNKVAEDDMDQRPTIDRHATKPGKQSFGDSYNALPNEDALARHTLWPEMEKLYGHGYEISAVAATHDGTLIASACRSSSPEHAVIRLYETKSWREVRPPLAGHSLTVTRLCFSHDDEYLLGVGRDRQHAIFKREKAGGSRYNLLTAKPKSHSRMILGAAWAPGPRPLFATAGRDKLIKVWALEQEESMLQATIQASAPVNSIDILPMTLQNVLLLAYGTDTGGVTVCGLDQTSFSVRRMLDVQGR